MNCTPKAIPIGAWLQITHIIYVYQSWFYYTASHYLRPKLYYYTWLVKIALGLSRNLKVYSRRFTSTKRLYINLSILCLIIQDPSKPFRVYILTDKAFYGPPICTREQCIFIFIIPAAETLSLTGLGMSILACDRISNMYIWSEIKFCTCYNVT